MDAIDFAILDQADVLRPDPSIWQANLAAAALEQPEYANRLKDAALPAHWRPASGLDGFPTYRIEPQNAPPAWLSGAAAPLTRAENLLRLKDHAEKNPALPSIATGAFLKLLLERLTRRQAVYVFERNPTLVAAVLRNIDFSEDIRIGRCILLPPNDEAAYLASLLERHAGLEPPGTLVAAPHIDEQEIERISRICEPIARDVSETRNRRLAELSELGWPVADNGKGRPAIAILALSADPLTYRRADELTTAAESLGWRTCRRTASGPRDIHMLPHCEALAEFAPDLTICIAHAPGSITAPPERPVCQWHPYARGASADPSTDKTIHLAASPAVEQALLQAGVPDRRIVKFYWALPDTLDQATSPGVSNAENWENSKAVVLFGDLPDTADSACGIEQPTHKQLWAQLHITAKQAWDKPDILRGGVLLHKAEQACGVKLGDIGLRERMVRIIEHVLIHAAVLQTIVQELQQRSYEVWAIGRGWNRGTSVRVNKLSDAFDQLSSAGADVRDNAPAMLAAVFAGTPDPLRPELFFAAARGWPILLHNPAAKPMTDRLGAVLHPEQHYQPFAGMPDLLAELDSIQKAPERARRRCAHALEHARSEHTYRNRLLALAKSLDFEWTTIT